MISLLYSEYIWLLFYIYRFKYIRVLINVFLILLITKEHINTLIPFTILIILINFIIDKIHKAKEYTYLYYLSIIFYFSMIFFNVNFNIIIYKLIFSLVLDYIFLSIFYKKPHIY